jgi:hypothetical protein
METIIVLILVSFVSIKDIEITPCWLCSPSTMIKLLDFFYVDSSTSDCT